jgi:hypothetical protein|tara:strand:- start:338 stop:493 length:156 start_codon:yes stop_codon:yes gene_type:complete
LEAEEQVQLYHHLLVDKVVKEMIQFLQDHQQLHQLVVVQEVEKQVVFPRQL